MEFSPFAEYYRETLGDVNFLTDKPGRVAWIFLDAYRERALEAQALYPGGELIEGREREGAPGFYAYVIEAETPREAQATP